MALGKGLNSLIPQKPSKPKKDVSVSVEEKKEEYGQRVLQIPVTTIVPNRQQPRVHFDESALQDLVASIKKHGIMQPLTVSELPDGGYELIAGERRFRAAGLAKLATVPAIVRQAGDQERLELALIENIQRQDLNPVEEAYSYQRLVDEFHLTQQQVAEQVGKSRSAVANRIRLLDLPEEILEALKNGSLSPGKARALLSLKSEAEQLELFRKMSNSETSVRDVERVVSQKQPNSRKGGARRDPNLVELEQQLEGKLGTKVRITSRGDKGTVTIEYFGTEELRRIIGEIV